MIRNLVLAVAIAHAVLCSANAQIVLDNRKGTVQLPTGSVSPSANGEIGFDGEDINAYTQGVARKLVDDGSAQTVGGNKTFTGSNSFTGDVAFSGTVTGISGGGGSSSSFPTPGVVADLRIGYVGTNSVTVSAAYAVLTETTGVTGTGYPDVTELIDISASVGAGGPDKSGLDTADRWLSLWLIGKDDGTIDGLVSDEDPTVAGDLLVLPSGYTNKIRIGWIRQNGSSAIRAFTKVADHVWFHHTPSSAARLVNCTDADWVTHSAAAWAPPGSAELEVEVSVGRYGSDGLASASWRETDYPAHIWTAGYGYSHVASGSAVVSRQVIPVNATRSFDVKNTSGGTSVCVDIYGYFDPIGK